MRKEVLELEADPRSPERGQYGFLQALVQRVAYETLSRRDRKAKHVAAAEYLGVGAGIEADEIAEVIAAHYRDAWSPTRKPTTPQRCRARARDWLCRAGERAASLAAIEDAKRAFDDALGLTDASAPLEQAPLLERAGELCTAANDPAGAETRLRRAYELYVEGGRPHEAARAAAALSLALWAQGRSEETIGLLDSSLETLASDKPDADVAKLASEAARVHLFLDHPKEAGERVELALAIAEAQQLPEVLSQALNTKALLRTGHPREQWALMNAALDDRPEHDLVAAALRAYNNLVVLTGEQERYDERERIARDALDLARRRGYRSYVVTFAGTRCLDLIDRGDWDEAFRLAAADLPDTPSSSPGGMVTPLFLADAALERDTTEARRLLDLAEPDADSLDYQQQSTALYKQMLVAVADGRLDDALDVCSTAMPLWLEHYVPFASFVLGEAVTLAGDLDRTNAIPPLLEQFEALTQAQRIREVEARSSRACAAVAAAAGNREAADEAFAHALGIARSLDLVRLTAPILAEYGSWLTATDRADDGAELLAEARAALDRMGSKVWLERLERLQRAATATQLA